MDIYEIARNQYLHGMDYQPVYWELLDLCFPDPFDWCEPLTWQTRTGEIIPLKAMTTTHLRNCINLVGGTGVNLEMLTHLRRELVERN